MAGSEGTANEPSRKRTNGAANEDKPDLSCIETVRLVRPYVKTDRLIARPFWTDRIEAGWRKAPSVWLSGVPGLFQEKQCL